ncbi:sugar phosphate isomerase/epimerase [Sneathiella marina]|uniref:Sugar phosphate isomerase/epimerase n=1 Tax=Sneathiella marina TaxID=2950108 RepID=A0ABY4W1K3_9PROT|nr:sugar phosphate isomerase/epimerase family protein [Sneathiella marina]USG61048.1 sugar phosphate isomerase/epimerase [Sneathiella marina]
MHLSTHNWMRAESVETTLRRGKQYGLESIEISGEPDQYDTKEIRAILNELDMFCWGSVTLTLGDRNLAAKDEGQRAATVDYMKRVATMAHELGGRELTVVPATVGKVTPDGTPEEEWQWVINGLKEIYELTESYGIKIGLEPLNRFETYFLNRADQAVALAKEVGPNCGVCLDAFHLNIEEEDFHAAIRSAGDMLVDFHVADNNRMPPGMGQLNWAEIVKTLKDINYTGGMTLEFVTPIDRTPVTKWPNQVETDPVDISPEQLKFIEDHGSSLLSEEFYTEMVKRSCEHIVPLIR